MSENRPIETVKANGLDIAYEVYGERHNPIIALVHGLGSPMAGWPMGMVNQLVDKGFCVLRVDNRDSGKSQILDDTKSPNFLWQVIKSKIGIQVTSAYDLTDMVDDLIGVLDALEMDRIHLVGASMGGMICQLTAIHHSSRVKSLTSIMSHAGSKQLPPRKAVAAHLFKKPVIKNVEEAVAYNVKTWELLSGTQHVMKSAERKSYVLGLMDRGISATGTSRQLLAIMAAKDRTEALSTLTMPCQVIHGKDDPLIHVQGGIDTAKAIPNCELHLIDGMGHDFPVSVHEAVCTMITDQVKQTENHL